MRDDFRFVGVYEVARGNLLLFLGFYLDNRTLGISLEVLVNGKSVGFGKGVSRLKIYLPLAKGYGAVIFGNALRVISVSRLLNVGDNHTVLKFDNSVGILLGKFSVVRDYKYEFIT